MHFIMYGCVYNLLSTTCMGTLGPDKDNAVSPEPSETGGQGTRGLGGQGARRLLESGSQKGGGTLLCGGQKIVMSHCTANPSL